MKDSLKPGIRYQHTFTVPPSKTVPALYPESDEFLAMPEVFTKGVSINCFPEPTRRGVFCNNAYTKRQVAGARDHRGVGQVLLAHAAFQLGERFIFLLVHPALHAGEDVGEALRAHAPAWMEARRDQNA